MDRLITLISGVQDSLTKAAKTVEKSFEERFQDTLGFSFADAKHKMVDIGTNLIIAIIIVVVGWWLAKTAGRAINKVMTKSKTDAGLITFLTSLVVISLKILVILTAVTQLGVQMTSFITILGAAGLAIGMAFSGTLSNFAGGVMILFFKPFKVGDTILALTHEGKVSEIQIFYTYLNTGDNKVVILPNGPLANGNLVNFTREKKRRVEWIFVLEPTVDYLKAHAILMELIQKDKRVLSKPEPTVILNGLKHGAPQVIVRAWVSTEVFSSVHADYNEAVYKTFIEKEIQFFKEG